MINIKKTAIYWAIAGLSVGAFSLPAFASTVTLHPIPLHSVISNPGMGVEDFQGNVLPVAEYPTPGVDYYRFYWDQLEPQEGQFNFDLINKIIVTARHANPPQTIALRFMTMADPGDGSKIPDWLIHKGIKGVWEGKTFVPDLNDPLYLSYVKKLLMAFGQQFDGNPYISSMDIGIVGSWGEWHNSNYPSLPKLANAYSNTTLKKYVNLYFQAFPHTPKVMLINDSSMLGYATSKGAGWRADCWGDFGVFSSSWSHMKDAYPLSISQATAINPKFASAWQNAPVNLETCYTMENWWQTQHYTRAQVKTALDWAIAHHVSNLNLKSSAIPKEYRDLLDNALTHLGYRLRLASVTYPTLIQNSQTLSWTSSWVNEGVAPPYYNYALAYRLVGENGKTAVEWRVENNVTKWLPGEHDFTRSYTLPTLSDGTYHWQVAFLGANNKPALTLAMEGKQADGWYDLGNIQIQE